MRAPPVLAVAWIVASLVGCSTYHDDLARSQTAFEQNNHERVLAILRALEPDQGRLDARERGHYAYLRGMTDYRIGYRAEARHWLLVARALENAAPGTLPEDWKARLVQALTDLDEQVYKAGSASLTNTRRPQGEEPKAFTKAKSEDEP